MPRELAAYLGVDFLIGIGVVYLLLGLVTAAILFLPSTRFIGSTSATGAAWVWGEARFRYQDLQDAIYGAPSSFISGQQVHAGTICLILLGVLLLLIWIAATRALD
jgi:hypothetical protein